MKDGCAAMSLFSNPTPYTGVTR